MGADLHRVARGPAIPPGLPSSPTSSFFLASTLITGCPAARCSLACAAMYRNWASRSGCRLPSATRALAWVENPSSCRRRRPSAGCTGARPQSLAGQLLHALGRPQQRRSGSPRLESATSTRGPPGTRPGSVPGQLLCGPRPAGGSAPAARPGPNSSSAAPSATVCHDAPVTLATRADPPSSPGQPPPASAAAPSHPAPAAGHFQLRPHDLHQLRARAHSAILTRDAPETQVNTE